MNGEEKRRQQNDSDHTICLFHVCLFGVYVIFVSPVLTQFFKGFCKSKRPFKYQHKATFMRHSQVKYNYLC